MVEISVVIPVYNAEKFIEKAVLSALQFDVVKEVVLVEDGSKDSSLKICEKLSKEDSRVKLYRHPNGENRGAGSSRNLAILKSTSEYISFLDSDDYYLENRFLLEESKLKLNEIDGIYHAIGIHYYNNQLNQNSFFIDLEVTTVRGLVEPEELKFVLFDLHKTVKGYFSLDGLTVKKSKLLEVGLFNEALFLHQDTDLCYKLSLSSKLIPGQTSNPVARRGVHENNRISSSNNNWNSKLNLLESISFWLNNNFPNEEKIIAEVQKNLKYHRFLVKKNKSLIGTFFFIFSEKEILFDGGKVLFLLSRTWLNNWLKSFMNKIKQKSSWPFLKSLKSKVSK